MKLEEMALVLGKATLLTPNFTLSPETIRAWYELFHSEATQTFQVAFNSVMKEPGRKYFPSPGEISAAIEIVRNNGLPQAEETWNKIIEFAKRGTPEAKVLEYFAGCGPALLALRCVTYRAFQFESFDTLPFRKREFITCYNEAVERHERRERIEATKQDSKKFLDSFAATTGIKLLGPRK